MKWKLGGAIAAHIPIHPHHHGQVMKLPSDLMHMPMDEQLWNVQPSLNLNPNINH